MKLFILLLLYFGSICFNQISKVTSMMNEFDKFLKDISTNPPLLITRNENRYKLSLPVKYSQDIAAFVYPISKGWEGRTFYMCPDGILQDDINISKEQKQDNRKALYVKQYTTNEPTADEVKCFYEVEPIITKILKDNSDDWFMDIKLFGVGFQIFIKDIEAEQPNHFASLKRCIGSTCSKDDENTSENTIDVKLRFDIHEDYDCIPLVFVYFDEKKQQTIAVSYELIPTELPLDVATSSNFEKETVFRNTYFYQSIMEFPAIQKFMFRDMFGASQNFITNEKYFVGQPLVSENDFIAPLWKKAARFKFYLEPMWNILTPKWKEIDNLSRRLTEKFGKLFITNGTSGVLKMMRTENQELKLAEWNKNDDKISFPSLFWKIIEYNLGEERKQIIIIMHNNIYEKEGMICKDDISAQMEWKIFNPDYKTGLIYVCDFTKEIEDKLNINFILKRKELSGAF